MRMRPFLYRTFWMTLGILFSLCLSWWHEYHRLPQWNTFVIAPCVSAVGAAFLEYREARRQKRSVTKAEPPAP